MSEQRRCSPTIVTDQARDDCEPQARCPVCSDSIALTAGHRRRVYCSDSCKQRAYLDREARKLAEQRRARLRAAYPTFSEQTLDLLERLEAVGNHELVERIATAIVREQQELEQEVTRYRQIVDLSDREKLEWQFYDIGEQIGYRRFIPADHLLAVGAGVEYWRAFVESASDADLAAAVVRVRHYAENLIVVEAQMERQRAKQVRESKRHQPGE
ncbi:MAG TPA: hypothetical protein VKV40_10835 [Ktedonobacteraceae bacterium]|nr:hypothetical protein [Ktedonobacteraceae bacterium]